MNIVGDRLKQLRESVRLSQAKIAEKMGGKQTSVNRYESGQTTQPLNVLLWYADYFDVSLDYIFGRTANPQGKLYNYEPKAIKEKITSDEEMQQFIEMCFDPNSPVSAKLKESLIKMIGGAK